MLWKTRDVCDHLKCININNNIPRLKVCNESLMVLINGDCVNLCVELGNQFDNSKHHHLHSHTQAQTNFFL